MPSSKEVSAFVKSQRSVWIYPKFQRAMKDVLLVMPDSDYRRATKNTVFMVLHEIALAQAMHVPPRRSKFCIVQVSIARRAPIEVLRYVIAHELGHVLQGRNWKKGDGKKLEIDADRRAEQWGFPRTKRISAWMKKHRKMARSL